MSGANFGVLHFNSSQFKSHWLKLLLLIVLLMIFSHTALAGSTQTLGDVANNITKSMSGLAKLITAASYVAGIGFAMMGMLKLKAHKDNPVQVPLGQPIVLLVIAVGLIFLPNLINTGGVTLWGEQANHREARSDHFDLDSFG